MIKKDYIKIAKAIKEVSIIGGPDNGLTPTGDLICILGTLFLHENPRFNWVKFQEACGIKVNGK